MSMNECLIYAHVMTRCRMCHDSLRLFLLSSKLRLGAYGVYSTCMNNIQGMHADKSACRSDVLAARLENPSTYRYML